MPRSFLVTPTGSFEATPGGSFEATPGGRFEQGLVELVGAFLAPGRRPRLFLFCDVEGSLAVYYTPQTLPPSDQV